MSLVTIRSNDPRSRAAVRSYGTAAVNRIGTDNYPQLSDIDEVPPLVGIPGFLKGASINRI